MLRVNMMERVQVVNSISGISFGRIVLNNRGIAQRKLLAKSINDIVSFFKANGPEELKGLLQCFENGIINPIAMTSLEESYIDHEDIEFHGSIFDVRHDVSPWVKRANDFLCKKTVNGQCLQLTIKPIALFNISFLLYVVRIQCVPRKTARPSKQTRAGAAHNPVKSITRGKIYTRSELQKFFIEFCADSNLELEFFFNTFISTAGWVREVVRPERFWCDEGLFYAAPKDGVLPDGIIVVFAEIPAVAKADEIDEMVKEKRLIPVLVGKPTPAYYSPHYLARAKEKGEVIEMENEVGCFYVKLGSVGAYEGLLVVSRKNIFTQDILRIIQTRRISPEDKNCYPFLSAAIERACDFPCESERYFRAAAMGAEMGASELSTTALIMNNPQIYFNSSCFDQENLTHDHLFSFRRYLSSFLANSGMRQEEIMAAVSLVKHKIGRLNKVSSLKDDFNAIKDMQKLYEFIVKKYLYSLKAFSPEGQGDAFLEHCVATLASLMFRLPGELKLVEEKYLRVIVAPIAEAMGFSDLAAKIRNEILRITRNKEYNHVQFETEKIVGLSYFEMQVHLDGVVNTVRAVLAAAGISLQDFEIQARVKLPYSVWEKMESLSVSTPAFIKDIFGLNIIAANDRLAYGIMRLLRQAFKKLSKESFDDKHGLMNYLEETGQPIFIDNIREPLKSGFSALKWLALTEPNAPNLILPIEVQVTTLERHKRNYRGEAAHWKHKMKREIKTFLGIEIDKIDDLEEHMPWLVVEEYSPNGSKEITFIDNKSNKKQQ